MPSLREGSIYTPPPVLLALHSKTKNKNELKCNKSIPRWLSPVSVCTVNFLVCLLHTKCAHRIYEVQPSPLEDTIHCTERTSSGSKSAALFKCLFLMTARGQGFPLSSREPLRLVKVVLRNKPVVRLLCSSRPPCLPMIISHFEHPRMLLYHARHQWRWDSCRTD